MYVSVLHCAIRKVEEPLGSGVNVGRQRGQEI